MNNKIIEDISRVLIGVSVILGHAVKRESEYINKRTSRVVGDMYRSINKTSKINNNNNISINNNNNNNIKRHKEEPKPIRPSFKLKKQREFNPIERKVPSSQISRALGFGNMIGQIAMGVVAETGRSIFGSSPFSSSNNNNNNNMNQKLNNNNNNNNNKISNEGDVVQSNVSKILNEPNMERLAAGLCRLRGAALKVGQMLSIQDESLVPPQLQQILARVRDQAEIMPKEQLLNVLKNELGKDWQEKLKSFNMKPIAAASIGQVHEAILKDDTKVVMKIQYPGVSKSIDSDIANLKRLVKLMAFLPKGLYLDDSMAAAKEELALECNYIYEAKCQEKFRQLLLDDKEFYVPRVINKLSTRSILTTEYVSGVSLSEIADVELPNDTNELERQQEERNRVAFALLRLCLKELFEWRFLQSDPNWSNFLYNSDTGIINLVDFGATREYNKKFVDNYLRMVKACADRDRDEVIRLSIELGFLTGDESKVTIDAHVEAGFIVGEPFATDDIYDFGNARMAERVSERAGVMLKGRLTPPPKDSYTLHRKLSGAFLSCKRLNAKISCRSAFMNVYNNYKFDN